ncbi:MAG: hypothetical protein JXC33_07640 [Deltaproteobacteria bacterium]|nr:hypothetical protein [Deltaproteobacteria bacterium]
MIAEHPYILVINMMLLIDLNGQIYTERLGLKQIRGIEGLIYFIMVFLIG